MTLRIANFDIGKKNFAQYIEDADVATLEKLEIQYKNLPKKLQRKTKGIVSPQMRKIIDTLYTSGTRVYIGTYDLRDDPTSDKLDMSTRKNIIAHLEKYKYLWNSCDIFVIEQQFFSEYSFSRNRKVKKSSGNVDAIKIAELVTGFFLKVYPHRVIMQFPSTYKTQLLGAPAKLSKPQRKQWSVDETQKICEMRGDEECLELFKLQNLVKRKRLTAKFCGEVLSDLEFIKYNDTYELAEKIVKYRQKLDDFSDCVTQCQAFKLKYLVIGE